MIRASIAMCAVVLAALAAPAAAAPRVIALTPLSTLGSEVSSADAKKITAELETALGAIPDVQVVGAIAVSDAIKKNKQQRLTSCDGDPGCLKDVGTLVGADLVVYGELGGLGDAEIVYLKLVDTKVGREVRGTTLDVNTLETGGARGAAYRLLDPGRYTGTIALTVDVTGAQVYINGKLVGKSPVPPQSLPVGTHAVRVTHPEYHDFVRFVDVEFDKQVDVPVGLQQFPVVQTDIEGLTGNTKVKTLPAKWYRRWWAVAAFTAVAFSGALLVADFAGCRGICPSPDYIRPVNGQ